MCRRAAHRERPARFVCKKLQRKNECFFWRSGKSWRLRGGRRQGAKRPERARPGPKAPGALSGCRKSGLRHFFEVFIAPLRLRRGQGAMQGNPCYARLFADLTRMSPNPIIASGGCGPRTPKVFSTGCAGAGAKGPRRPGAPPVASANAKKAAKSPAPRSMGAPVK